MLILPPPEQHDKTIHKNNILYCLMGPLFLDAANLDPTSFERFPEDFMFQLTEEEWESLRSQFATLKPGRGDRYMRPSVIIIDTAQRDSAPHRSSVFRLPC